MKKFTPLNIGALAVLAAIFFVSHALAINTSATSSGTQADDASIGTVAWGNPTNASASDNAYATIGGADNAISHYLTATNFGFSIPSNSTITGVLLEVEKHDGLGDTVDSSVKLINGGVISGIDKANTVSVWGASDFYASYGSNSDAWGIQLTPAIVNASNFGAAFSCKLLTTDVGADALVDHIRMTIFYNGQSQVKQITVL